MVVRPHTTEASCKYGTGTKWCIAATATRNYYSTYSVSNNKFYFVIDKKAEPNSVNSKFAIVIVNTSVVAGDAIQVYNAADHQVGLGPVKAHLGDKWAPIWKLIQDHVEKNPSTREVEDARKATEEHVKALLKGETVSRAGLEKIAKDAKLTTPVVNAMIAAMKTLPPPQGYDDPMTNMMREMCQRAQSLTPEGAVALLAFADEKQLDKYYKNRLLRDAPLPPESLRTMAQNSNEETLSSLVGNPNMPLDVIEQLAGQLANIRSSELKKSVYLKLIKTGRITTEQMIKAMEDYSIRWDVIHNPSATEQLQPEMLSLIPVRGADEFKKLLELPRMTPEISADLIIRQWKNLPKTALYDIMKTIKLPIEMIEKIWTEGANDKHLRVSLLQNPSVGEDNITKFAKSKNHAYRFSIAHNPATKSETLAELASDESASTRAAVAAHPETTPEVLKKLAGDDAVIVRANVANNRRTPHSVLALLKKDTDGNVKKTAARTLKSLTRTEAFFRNSFIINEELADDDENEDIMHPSWRDISAGDVQVAEFICVYLLQNNGHASREEIEEAYQSWRGQAGTKELWRDERYSAAVIRGASAGGSAWYWAPPGINTGAEFRLTPAGASVAMNVLKDQANKTTNVAQRSITSREAKPGKEYYVSNQEAALNITGYDSNELSVEKVLADRNGNPTMSGGKYEKATRRRDRSVMIYKYTGDSAPRYITRFPIVNLPYGTKVTYIRPFIGRADGYNSESNKAVVGYNDMVLIINFPLWLTREGEVPQGPKEPNIAPPVKKSPPPRELNPNAAAAPAAGEPAAPRVAAAAPRGPKTTYKVYGRHRGHPVHTRLKGKAFVGPGNTQFSPGEQAYVSPEEDKLRVKKTAGDHSQLWEPEEG
jgi:hypothetical protein